MRRIARPTGAWRAPGARAAPLFGAVAALPLVAALATADASAQARNVDGGTPPEARAGVNGRSPASRMWSTGQLAGRPDEAAPRSGWQLGLEVADDPAGLLRWEVGDREWVFAAGATAGPGAGDVRFRIGPHLRLQRRLLSRFRVGAGLGLEWARLARSENDEESELQWDVSVGWRATERLLAEAGIRWTDYRIRRASPHVRVVVPLGGGRPATPPRSSDPEPARSTVALAEAAPAHAALQGLGVPPTATAEGRLDLPVEPVERPGSGIVLVAANPRGDPDPRSGAAGPNVDRLGLGTEAWSSAGVWSGWARWRSDLHTDPSIEDRVRAATEGRFFPVSVSFSGGTRWRPDDRRSLGAALRHDPRALVWLPHLGAERTARLGSVVAGGSLGRGSVEVAGTLLEPLEGRTVDPLDHWRVGLTVGALGALRVGVEHERLAHEPSGAEGTEPGGVEPGDRVALRRSRAVVAWSGPLSARLLAGDDVALTVGTSTEHGAWRLETRASYRSEPELLDYDRLVADGWMREVPTGASLEVGDVWEYGASVGRGPVRMELHGTVGDPVWSPGSTERAAGGRVDLLWTDRLLDGTIDGRIAVRAAEWGPDHAWWREQPSAEGRVQAGTSLGPARLSVLLSARTELSSARAGVRHPAGAEIGVGLSGPLPDLGSLRGMTVSMRLDDLLDSGLPVRVGAPDGGRHLTLALAWMSRSGVDR